MGYFDKPPKPLTPVDVTVTASPSNASKRQSISVKKLILLGALVVFVLWLIGVAIAPKPPEPVKPSETVNLVPIWNDERVGSALWRAGAARSIWQPYLRCAVPEKTKVKILDS